MIPPSQKRRKPLFPLEDYKLCYLSADEGVVYFTTKELTGPNRQWGDDWNDAPISCNAGTPYTPHPARDTDWDEAGNPLWDVIRCKLATDLLSFEDTHSGLFSCTVERINNGELPWLIGNGVALWAGTSYPEFCKAIHQSGGAVGLPYSYGSYDD